MNVLTLDLEADAAVEARRLSEARAWTGIDDAAAIGRGDELAQGPLATRARRNLARRSLSGRALLIFRVSWRDVHARALETQLIGALVPVAGSQPSLRSREHIRAVVADAEAAARPHVEVAAARLDPSVVEAANRHLEARLRRERAIADRSARTTRSLVQTGLFDRRAERAHQHTADANAERERQLTDRLRADD
jgi:hypothetical protein